MNGERNIAKSCRKCHNKHTLRCYKIIRENVYARFFIYQEFIAAKLYFAINQIFTNK